MRKWKLIFAAMMLAAVFVLSGCGGGSSLVGRWERTYGTRLGPVLEFFSDGRVMEATQTGTFSGEWTAEGGRLLIDFGRSRVNSPFVFSYQVSGSRLILTDDNGRVIEFERSR